MSEAKISKWQKKSNQVNDIRWTIEKILSEDLTDEEKQSDKYKELVQSVQVAFEHSSPDLAPKPSLSKIWLVTIATSSGAIIVEVIRLISALFTGQPTL